MSRTRSIRALSPLLALLVTLIGSPVAADVSVRLAPYEDGKAKARPRRYLPIAVEFNNTGRETVKGVLRAFYTRRKGVALAQNFVFHETRVALPRGRRIETIHYYVQHREEAGRIAVQFIPEEGEAPDPLYPDHTIVEEDLPILCLSNTNAPITGLLAGLVVPTEDGLCKVQAGTSTGLLPTESRGYEPYVAVVFSDVELDGLTELKRKALADWVASGGVLIVAPGLQAGQLDRSPIKDLLPIEPGRSSQTADRPLNALRLLTGGEAPGEPARVHAVTPRPLAAVLARTTDDVPLVVSQKLGLGRVTLLTFPMTAAGFQRWRGHRRFLGSLLAAPVEPPCTSDGISPLAEWMLNVTIAIEPLKPPTLLWIGPIILLYALLVAPVSATFARRRGTGWYFISVLIFVAGTTGAILFGSRATMLHSASGAHASVVQFPVSSNGRRPEEPALVSSRIGTFFGEGRLLTMTPSPGAAAWPVALTDSVRECRVVESGAEVKLENVKARRWSFLRFGEQRRTALGGFSSELKIRDNVVVGEITNHTEHELRNASLIFGGVAAGLGRIKPGQTKEVKVNLRTTLSYKDAAGPLVSGLVQELRGKTYKPFLATIVSDAVDPGERIWRSLERRSRIQRDPDRLNVLLAGEWMHDPCGFSTGLEETVHVKHTLALASLPMACPDGKLSLLAEAPRALAMTKAVFERGGRTLAIEAGVKGDVADPPGEALLAFSAPQRPGLRFVAERIRIVGRMPEVSRVQQGWELTVPAPGTAGDGKVKLDTKGFTFSPNDSERFWDTSRGAAFLRIRNWGASTIELRDIRGTIRGRYVPIQ